MAPLPHVLAQGLWSPRPDLPKRERTRLQLAQAAIRVIGTRGYAAATMQEVASDAGMTVATVYNHFKTKDAVAQEVAVLLADTLCRRIAESYAGVKEGAQRMAIGNLRYLWLARESPQWAALLMEIGAAAPHLRQVMEGWIFADLRLGVRQKAFRVPSEAVALDLIRGTVGEGMRTIAAGGAPAHHARDVSATVLRGLGMTPEAALEVAKRPLPPL